MTDGSSASSQVEAEELRELQAIRIQQFYEDARARANSAEAIMADALRSLVLLNGAGFAIVTGSLAAFGSSGLSEGAARNAGGWFAIGATAGVLAVAFFALSSFARSYFELQQAEILFSVKASPIDRRLYELKARYFGAPYIGGLAFSGIFAIASMSVFVLAVRSALVGA